MHDKPARAARFLEEYKRTCKQSGCHIVVENGELVVNRATAPLIDDTVAAINKRHREAAAPPVDEPDDKPAEAKATKPAKSPRGKKPAEASASTESAD